MTRRVWVGTVATAVALALAGCGGGDDDGGGAAEGGVAGSEAAVAMQGVNNSGEFGTTSLFAEGDKTRVLVDTQGPFDREFEQPAEIVKGECPEPTGEPAFKLNVLQDGVSETTVDASLDELRAGGYVIIVRKAKTDDTITECGSIAAT
jgi:hypothetical protein